MSSQPAGGRLLASVSLDLDNLWSYLKTYGDPAWTTLPSYLPVVVPRMLELFARFDLAATVFVVGQDTVVSENVEPLRAIVAAGHEVGNHSWHHEPWLHEYSRDRLVEELARTEEGLVQVTGQRPTGFRAPGYSLSPILLDVLAERGYLYDASTLPTWIGPLARAYYFRSAKLAPEEREQRRRLFGQARDVLRPNRPYLCGGTRPSLVEIPVTTLPLARVPMHFSYVLYLYGVSPALARGYFRTALNACRAQGLGPSLLLHPLDLLDGSDAPGVGFFPGMGLRAKEKETVITWCLTELNRHFRLVGTGTHARSLIEGGRLPYKTPSYG